MTDIVERLRHWASVTPIEDLPEAADEITRLRALNAELVEALDTFLTQWNACGPNSDFGRYFSSVRDKALTAVARAKELPHD